jgi:integrase
MPIKAKELSAIQVRRLVNVGYYAVGGVAGLHLQVTASGARSWVLRYTTGEILTSKSGKPFYRRRDLGLGGFPDVTLEQARDKARDAKDNLTQGIDPILEKRSQRQALIASQATAKTFDECAATVHKIKSKEFRNSKHTDQWINSLDTYASPVIGKMSIADIEINHIVKILEPIWLTKNETASRVRQRIESVIDWATASGFRQGDNPARLKGNIDTLLPKSSKVKVVKHHKALSFKVAGGFMHDLRKQQGVSAKALEFTILTAARSGEVRGAKWGEIDFEEKVWTIPADRMKAGKVHRVPLTDQCIKLLEGMRRQESGLIFPGIEKNGVEQMLSDMSLSAVLKRMKVDVTVHGFRSTFRDWTAEATNYPNHVAEMGLAHAIESKVEAAYRRGELMAKRRQMMTDWATHLDLKVKPANVTPIRSVQHG